MKSYPSITTKYTKGVPCYAFNKIDGSNIRAEWSRKQGFYKFGTRNRLLDEGDPIFGEAKGLIENKYGDKLSDVFSKQRWDRVVAFFEFYGENSFAGSHQEETHDVVLFDVDVYKRGIIDPKTFLDIFDGKVEIPAVLYEGNITEPFYESVRNSTLEGMTCEGVVCKWKHPKRSQAEMCKIKSKIWLDKLKEYCNDNPILFNQLK